MRRHEDGYAMAALLVAMAVMAIMLTAAMPVWKTTTQREKEAELIFRGQQYARAIGLYQRKMGPGTLPPSIDMLVDQRYLRKKYKDPITNDDFQLLSAAQAAGGLGGQPGAGQPGGAARGQQPLGQATGGGGGRLAARGRRARSSAASWASPARARRRRCVCTTTATSTTSGRSSSSRPPRVLGRIREAALQAARLPARAAPVPAAAARAIRRPAVATRSAPEPAWAADRAVRHHRRAASEDCRHLAAAAEYLAVSPGRGPLESSP